MSSTNRSDARRKDDFYSTPAWVTRAILPHLPKRGDVLDPCAGDGSLLEVLGAASDDVRGIEIDEGRSLACRSKIIRCVTGDALAMSWSSPALIITNPPFSLAMEFVVKSLVTALPYGGTVAMLMRINWLASQERAAFHKAYPSDVYVLPRRPSFTGDGKCDSTDYGWFLWAPGSGNRWYVLDVEARNASKSSK